MANQQIADDQQPVQQPANQAPVPNPQKKPVFKKWWFWVIIVVVVVAIAGGMGSGKSGTVRSDTSGSASATATSGNGEASQAGAAGQNTSSDTSKMAIGQTIDLKDGLSITVNSVEKGLANYDGSGVVGVNVTYTNNGKSGASFNVYDWKAEDPDGAQRSMAYYSNADNQLNSGKLSAGGTVTGNVYFDEPIAKIYYYSNVFNSDSDVAWVVE